MSEEKFEGFSQRWKDFPDYIIGITKEIWEDRGISTLHHYYDKDIIMRFPSGLVTGNLGVIASTAATLAQFPDRKLFGQDVIWSGNAEDGYLSSHRLYTSGTHLGDGYFGEPTGKKFYAMTIADCAAKNDTIYDEWLIRDSGAIVRCLDNDPKNFAYQLIEREGGIDKCVKPFKPEDNVEGRYQSKGNDNEWGVKYADILSRMMESEFSVIPKEYDRACMTYIPGGFSDCSHEFIDNFWLSLRSSFPNAEFTIDHQIGRDDPMLSPRSAIRWSLRGKHDGYGMFGAPTGADVYIMGFSHAEFGPWGIRREYTVFDEVSIWKQILMQQG